jgi:hypothetical protein
VRTLSPEKLAVSSASRLIERDGLCSLCATLGFTFICREEPDGLSLQRMIEDLMKSYAWESEMCPPVDDHHQRRRIVRAKLLCCTLVGLVTVTVLTCSTTRQYWKSEPEHRRLSNDYVDVELSPACDQEGCQAFQLSVSNKTDHIIEIDWNKTTYLTNGVPAAGFMLPGMRPTDSKKPKPPELIQPHSSRSETIWPSALVYRTRESVVPWKHGIMSRGENGVKLSLKVGGKEMSETLTVVLSVAELQK